MMIAWRMGTTLDLLCWYPFCCAGATASDRLPGPTLERVPARLQAGLMFARQEDVDEGGIVPATYIRTSLHITLSRREQR